MSARISTLPSIVSANIQDTDILPIVGTGITSKVTITELRAKLLSGGTFGISPDRGDVSPTLQVGNDYPSQQFATALTANRTITLSPTSAYNGATFRVTRTGLGAFTLDVGGLKTIPINTAAFVVVGYDGSGWRLLEYGTL